MIIGVNARVLLAHRMEGIARYLWETTKAMIIAHPDDQFILFFDRKYDENFIIAPNVKAVIVYPQARHPILWKIWFDYTLPPALKKHKIDVFYSPDGYCSLRTKVPTVVVSHDLAYVHFPESMRKDQLAYYQKNVPLFLEKSVRVIAVSQSTKDDIVANFGLDPNKINIAYNALQENVEIHESTDKTPYLLYLGSIHPRKNIIGLLQAYEIFRLQAKDTAGPRLIIAGRRAFQNKELDAVYDSMKFKEDVSFVGMVDEAEKWTLIQGAELFIYVSLFEGFGIPILEAMQMKTPVICSYNGALAEVAGDAGFLVNPEDSDSIANGIKQVLEDEKLREELISKGLQRVQDFSWTESAEVIYTCLQDARIK